MKRPFCNRCERSYTPKPGDEGYCKKCLEYIKRTEPSPKAGSLTYYGEMRMWKPGQNKLKKGLD